MAFFVVPPQMLTQMLSRKNGLSLSSTSKAMRAHFLPEIIVDDWWILHAQCPWPSSIQKGIWRPGLSDPFPALRRLMIMGLNTSSLPLPPCLEWLEINEDSSLCSRKKYVAAVKSFPSTLTYLSFCVPNMEMNNLRFDKLFPQLTNLRFWKYLDCLRDLHLGNSVQHLTLAHRLGQLEKFVWPANLTSLHLPDCLSQAECQDLPASLNQLTLGCCCASCSFTHLFELKELQIAFQRPIWISSLPAELQTFDLGVFYTGSIPWQLLPASVTNVIARGRKRKRLDGESFS